MSLFSRAMLKNSPRLGLPYQWPPAVSVPTGDLYECRLQPAAAAELRHAYAQAKLPKGVIQHKLYSVMCNVLWRARDSIVKDHGYDSNKARAVTAQMAQRVFTGEYSPLMERPIEEHIDYYTKLIKECVEKTHFASLSEQPGKGALTNRWSSDQLAAPYLSRAYADLLQQIVAPLEAFTPPPSPMQSRSGLAAHMAASQKDFMPAV